MGMMFEHAVPELIEVEGIQLPMIENTPAEEPSQDPKERFNELYSLFRQADDYRSQYTERAKEWFRIFVGYVKPLDDVYKGRSNLHIPKTYAELDTLRARLVKSFFGVRPFVDFIPIPQSGVDIERLTVMSERAKRAAALVDMQLEKNDIQRVWHDFSTSFLIYPAAILSVGWRYETRMVKRRVPAKALIVKAVQQPDGAVVAVPEEIEIPGQFQIVEEEAVVWDDNEIRNVDFWDFWADPMGDDIDSCRYVFQREFATKAQIERQLELLAQTGQGTVYPISWDEAGQPVIFGDDGKTERLSAIGLSYDSSEIVLGAEERERLGKHELLHYWEDERHAIILNRATVIYDGPNPYWRHGKKPFVVAPFDPLPCHFYGMSAAQLLEHLQAELNTQRNQRIDNVSLSQNVMFKVRNSADIDESDLVVRPAGIIHVTDQDDVTHFQLPQVNPLVFQEESSLQRDMDDVLAVDAIARGSTSSKRQTATEVVTKNNNASLRFDVKIMLAEKAVKRLAYLMDCNNQQFIQASRQVKLFGQNGTWGWAEVTPDEIIGEWDYRPAGSAVDPAANREVRREQLAMLVQFAYAINPPFIDKYALVSEWFRSFEIRGLEKCIMPKEQYEAMMQQQQQAALLAMLGQMQGQSGSGVSAGPIGPQGPIGPGGGFETGEPPPMSGAPPNVGATGPPIPQPAGLMQSAM